MPPAKKSATKKGSSFLPVEPISPGITVAERIAEGADAVAVLLFEESLAKHPYPGLDQSLGNAISQTLALGDFKAKPGTIQIVPVTGFAKRLVLLGLGKEKSADPENVRWAAGTLAKTARTLQLRTIGIAFHGAVGNALNSGAVAEALAEGLILGSFVFTEYKKPATSTDGKSAATAYTLLSKDPARHAALREAIAHGSAIGAATNITRHIASRPGNAINPTTLVAAARAFAAERKLPITVIDARQAAARGMGGLVAVGQGSVNPPALILIEYKGSAKPTKRVAVVGKAVTFDTGGISIKPAPEMGNMIYDKCGGMAVFGVLQAAQALQLPHHVIGVIPTAENAVGSASYRPGDVLRMFNGKTVEVTNTDAEGRLILADALAYACATYKPDAIIDLATLTGAIIVALGNVYAGLMSNDDALAAALDVAGQASGDMVWRMPLHARYQDIVDGHHTDLVNAAGRPAGSIAAAIFLQHFIPPGTAWAHIDIAGVAHPTKDDRYFTRGASGFGVRLITQYLRSLA